MVRTHVPKSPETPTPPEQLVTLSKTLTHPAVLRVGLTTTRDGRWALMAGVRQGTPTPIPAVESASKHFPVVYVDVPAEPPVARPAFPAEGE
jgi:hypothetical protein